MTLALALQIVKRTRPAASGTPTDAVRLLELRTRPPRVTRQSPEAELVNAERRGELFAALHG